MADSTITKLITKGKLDKAIEALMEGSQLSSQSDLYNNLIHLSGRYHRNENDFKTGMIDAGFYRMQTARISAALIDYNQEFEPPQDRVWLLGKWRKRLGDVASVSDEGKVVVETGKLAGAILGQEVEGENKQGETDSSTVEASGPDSKEGSDSKQQETVKKILYLAASPKGETRIEGDKEFRLIKGELARGRHRDQFQFLQPQFAVTASELIRSMRDKPSVIHFSGHGESEGLIISTDDNKPQLLPLVALKRLLKPLRGIAEILILNSCFSSELAKELSKFGLYVTGNNFEIMDTSSISFVKGLYNGLGEGKSIEEAYNDAMVVLAIENTEEIHILEIWKDGEKLDI